MFINEIRLWPCKLYIVYNIRASIAIKKIVNNNNRNAFIVVNIITRRYLCDLCCITDNEKF